MRRSGLALILVVGVLALLAVIGMAFVTLSRLERKAVQQRLWATKAYLLARSGLEDGMAKLGMNQDPYAAGSRYGGQDWNLNGLKDPEEAAALAFPVATFDPSTLASCPVRQAMRPSWFASGNLQSLSPAHPGRRAGPGLHGAPWPSWRVGFRSKMA